MKKITHVFILSLITLAPFVVSAQIGQTGPLQEDGTFINNTGPIGPATQDGQYYTAGSNQCGSQIKDLAGLLGLATCYISRYIIPLLFGIAILVFIWGVVQFISNADNEEKRTQGRDFMVYGIIALFVMVSVWGLVSVLSNTFGVKNVIPQLQSQ